MPLFNGVNVMFGVKNNTAVDRSGKRLLTSQGLKLSLIVAGLLVSGCASYERDHVIVGSVPSDYRTNHPIVVSESEVYEDIVVAHTMRGMSHRQENVVRNFTSRFRRSGARSVNILLPSASPNEVAARRVAKDIARYMVGEGLERRSIKYASYDASNHGDAATIRLSFNAMTAEVASECGKWEEDLIDTRENMNYGNFGCATQNNLAKMIANPEDLLGPRGESEIDATRRDNVITDWRDSGSARLPSLL